MFTNRAAIPRRAPALARALHAADASRGSDVHERVGQHTAGVDLAGRRSPRFVAPVQRCPESVGLSVRQPDSRPLRFGADQRPPLGRTSPRRIPHSVSAATKSTWRIKLPARRELAPRTSRAPCSPRLFHLAVENWPRNRSPPRPTCVVGSADPRLPSAHLGRDRSRKAVGHPLPSREPLLGDATFGPLLIRRASAAVRAARSRSASSSTMNDRCRLRKVGKHFFFPPFLFLSSEHRPYSRCRHRLLRHLTPRAVTSQ